MNGVGVDGVFIVFLKKKIELLDHRDLESVAADLCVVSSVDFRDVWTSTLC